MIRKRFETRILLAGMMAMTGCHHSAPSNPPVPLQLQGDSIVIVRTQSYFRTGPAYRVRVSRTGAVHFESRMPTDSGRVATFQVDPDTAQALIERAHGLGLNDLPSDLMGKAPYCRVVATDAPYVIVGLYGMEQQTVVRDYLGCFEHFDESGQGVIRRLRAFEADVDRIVSVGTHLPRDRRE